MLDFRPSADAYLREAPCRECATPEVRQGKAHVILRAVVATMMADAFSDLFRCQPFYIEPEASTFAMREARFSQSDAYLAYFVAVSATPI